MINEIRICDIKNYEDIKETYYLVRIDNIAYVENRKYKIPRILKTYIKKGKSNKYPCIKPMTNKNILSTVFILFTSCLHCKFFVFFINVYSHCICSEYH